MNEQKFTCILHIQRIPRVRISSFNQRLKLIDALSIISWLEKKKSVATIEIIHKSIVLTRVSFHGLRFASHCRWCNLKWSIVQEDRGLDISLREIRLTDHPVDDPGAFVPNIAELLGRHACVHAWFCAWNNVRGQLAGVRTRGEPRGEETNWLHGCLGGNNGVLSFAWKTIEITNWVTRALSFSPPILILK